MGTLMQGAIQAQQLQRPQNLRRQIPAQPSESSPGQEEQADEDDPLHPKAAPRPSPPASTSLPAQFAVNRTVLGSRFDPEKLPEGVTCENSTDFAGHQWCRRIDHDEGGLHALSLLLASDGTVEYVNRFVSPATFGAGEITQEVNRLTTRFKTPPHVLALPSKGQDINAVIVTWGAVSLVPLNADQVALLASGKSIHAGILLDYLGDVRASAQQSKPVYTITGGPGFLWQASYDQAGRGNLRFGAIDASSFSAPSATHESLAGSRQPFDPSAITGVDQVAVATPPAVLQAAPVSRGATRSLAASANLAPSEPGIELLNQSAAAPMAVSATPASAATYPQMIAGPSSQNGPLTRTVIVEGVGADVEGAAKNAAESALTQVVGSFIDTNTMLTKHTEISNGIKSETKKIDSRIQEYSQGAIQSISLGETSVEEG